jgi:hypothetical protein
MIQVMAYKTLKTSIDISATPEAVWSVLSDFNAYEKWNPFLKYIKGNVRKGNRIKINAGGMKFKPWVLEYREKEEIRWLGSLFFRGLFDGEHILRIENHHNGTVTFRQEEHFSGILVGLFAKKLDTETRTGFEQMNKRLKERSENKNLTAGKP